VALIRGPHQPHPPANGRPVGSGTGAAAVMLGGVAGARKVGKAVKDAPRGGWDDGVERAEGPAASAQEIKHLRKAVVGPPYKLNPIQL
jgi:hypothetical protein